MYISWAHCVLFPPSLSVFLFFFFFNDTATTEIYTLSLHDALPISRTDCSFAAGFGGVEAMPTRSRRSEEHTSELQSRVDLVCRLLLEKKKKITSVRYNIRTINRHLNDH